MPLHTILPAFCLPVRHDSASTIRSHGGGVRENMYGVFFAQFSLTPLRMVQQSISSEPVKKSQNYKYKILSILNIVHPHSYQRTSVNTAEESNAF